MPQHPPLSGEILLRCGRAHAALAKLNLAAQTLVNPHVLVNTLPVLETHSSNCIENIVTTKDSLFRYQRTPEQATDPAIKEALGYQKALLQFTNKNITISLIEKVVSTLKGETLTVRKKPVYIVNARHEVVYTPPDNYKTIHSHLTHWLKYLRRCDIDPLIQMALLHYQFEAIHPFIDGNGRSGRLLNILFLMQKQLLDQPVLYLSRYLLDHRPTYYKLLNQTTRTNSYNEWVLFMLQMVEVTSRQALQRLQAIKSLMDHTSQYIKPHTSSYHLNLMQVLFTQPYCRPSHLQSLGSKALLRLENICANL